MNYNRLIFLGRLVRPIELRSAASGTALAKFTLANNRKTKDGDEVPCYLDVVAVGKSAEALSKYLGKGDPLLIEGRLEYSSWEAKDGSKRSKLECFLERFTFLGGKKGDDEAPAPAPSRRQSRDEAFDPGDTPF